MSGRPSAAAARSSPDGTALERALLGGRVRSRVARLRASHSYGRVLALICVSFLFASLAPDAVWSASILVALQGGTLVVGLWTSGVARVDSPVSLALLTVAAAGVLVAVGGGRDSTAAVGFLSGALTVALAAVLARGVLDQGEVNRESITAAVCIYLLFGLFFVFLYGGLATLGSSPFFAQGTDGTRSVRVYFSFVTLATLGYGDYTPASATGRTLAVVEALIGQLYLVTVVAVFVARLSARRSGPLIPPG